MRLGIDLEYMASRDVVGLGRWVCSDAELQVLVSMTSDPDAQADYFYRLWTVKEAFVKAAGLNFPVDMRSVGFEGEPGRELRLRPPAGSWLVGVWRLDPGWMAALAWQGEIHDVRESVWRAGPGADLPLLSCLGIWHGTGV
jgi:4'-phosphopantetheinyl transferase